MIILLGGLVAAFPQLAIYAAGGEAAPTGLMAAQSVVIGLTAWLGVAWLVGAVILHFYNRWLLGALAMKANHRLDAGGGPGQ